MTANLDLRSGAEPAIRTYCATRGPEGGSSTTDCGVYFFQLIAFGPVTSTAYDRSARGSTRLLCEEHELVPARLAA